MGIRFSLRFSVRAYVCVRPSVRMFVRLYVCDPVRLKLRHLYQVELVLWRNSIAWASVYCGHISSLNRLYLIYP